jgi:hypothetical protein
MASVRKGLRCAHQKSGEADVLLDSQIVLFMSSEVIFQGLFYDAFELILLKSNTFLLFGFL